MREILAFAPVVCLIAYAVLTRQMAQAMVVAGVLAMAILHGANFLSGTIDSLYSVLTDSSYQFVLLIMVCFGGMIALLQKSGALQGFRDSLLRVAAGPRRSLFLAWCMGLLLFADEYLNALAVSFSFREITDRHRIPREHLAFRSRGWPAVSVWWSPSPAGPPLLWDCWPNRGWALRTIYGPCPICFSRC